MICTTFTRRSSFINKSVLAMTLFVAGLAHAQFTAYNDHRPSGTTSPNATGYDMIFTAAPMPLRDFASGTALSASLIVIQTGTPDDFGGNNYPNAGTPAYNLFNGIVDVGNNGIAGIRNSSGTSVTLTFTNLNPANFYKFRGAVVRGNSYVDRWSVFSLQGVNGFTDAHVDGSANNNLITISEFPTATLTNGQVAINSGENREGSLVAWDDIIPAADGTFSIRAEQYMGPTPFGNTANASTVYGYGFTAVYLEEVVGTITPITITNQPQSITVNERSPAVISVGASGSPIRYYWYRDGTLVPGNNSPNFSIPSTVYPGDNASQFYVVLSNSATFLTSSVATLTVLPDTNPPVAIRVAGALALDTITVTFNEPIDPNYDPSTFTFTLFETGTDPDSSPFITYSAAQTNGTNIILNTDPRAPGVGYSLRITDIRDASSGNNLINPNPTVVPVRTTIQLIGFDTDNEWKYDINNGDRTGTGWESPGFDDSTWLFGPAGLGLDASVNGVPIRTTLPYGANGVVVYFRRHFTFPAATNGVILFLRDVVEDGAVYYLNGQEIFRNRMPAGAVNFATLATGAPDPTPISGPFTLAITNLVPGDNVLAVEVHQSGATSSDIDFSAELSAEVQDFLSGPPVIRTEPQSQTVTEGGNASFSVVAEGGLPLFYQWRHGSTDLVNETNSTLTIVSASAADAGSYSVVVSNSFGVATSAAATLTVNLDNTAPQFLSAVADTNLTNITLVITDTGTGLNPANVANTANYDVHLRAGGGNLTILSATIVNGTNVVLVTSPRTQSQDYTIVLSNIRDNSAAANLVTPTTRDIRANIVVLAPDDLTLWRYESASNNLDGLGWELPAFNDAAWPQALAGFTTSNALEITTNGFELRTTNMLSPASGGPITTYYRVPFNFPGSLAGAALQIVGVVDDGLVAYINGVEAGRLRITNASPVSFTNLATAAGPETTDFHPNETITLTNLTGLVSGNNLLAIELHQNATTSSDSVLSVQLVAGITTFGNVPPPPRLSISRNATTGQMTISWTAAGCTLQETTTLLTPATTPWGPSSVANGVPFTPTGPMKFYRLSGCP